MRYIDMTDEELRAAYRAESKNLHSWSNMAQPRYRDGGRSADGAGRALRAIEFIENVARKRRVALVSCGEDGS